MSDNAQAATQEVTQPMALDVNSAADIIKQMAEPQEQVPEQGEPAEDVEAQEAEDADSEEPQAAATEQTEEGEEPEVQEPEPSPKYTVKVDGEEFEVTLEELRKGYQREADYTRKTMSLAEQRKAFEQEQQNKAQVAEKQLQEIAAVGKYLEDQLLAEFKSVNWEELRLTDPGEFAARRQDLNERAQQIQQIKAGVAHQAQAVKQQQEQQWMRHYPEFLKQQEELLVAKIPEWKEKKAERQKELREYLEGNGFTQQETNVIADHRFIVMADKARRYDMLQQAKPEAKKVLKEPSKMLKPGPKQTRTQQQREAWSSKFKDFTSRGGRVDDAARLISLLNSE